MLTMFHSKLFASTLLLVSISFTTAAQVNEVTFTAGEYEARGFESIINNSSLEQVNTSLDDYLESIGNKTVRKRGYFVVSAIHNVEMPDDIMLYGRVRESPDISVQFGLALDQIGEDNYASMADQIKKLAERFIIKIKIDELENELVEAEGAAAYKSKVFQKLVKESGSLESEMTSNREEKKRYERAIVELDSTYLNIQEKIKLNEELKALAIDELDKINLRIDQLKEALGKIE
jgi:hypothetical protein